MNSTLQKITDALVGVLNDPHRPPALYSLAYIKYPGREIQPMKLTDNTYSVKLSLWGYEYKHRGSRPRSPPQVNLIAIQAAFDQVLPVGLTVSTVENHGEYIILNMEVSYEHF